MLIRFKWLVIIAGVFLFVFFVLRSINQSPVKSYAQEPTCANGCSEADYDFNNDGVVNTDDATSFASNCLGQPLGTENCTDYDCDGEYTVSDALLFLPCFTPNTPTPTPTPFFYGCDGLTCKKVVGRESNAGDTLCQQAHENATCTNTFWSPIPDSWACSVSCGIGTDYRSCLCYGGAQDCCPKCSVGYGCGSTLWGSSCCKSQAPSFPIITEIKDGYGQIVYQPPSINLLDKLQTKIVTIKWTFPGNNSGCDQPWGYLCGGNTNSFKIKVNSKSDTIAPSAREYTTSGDTLIPNGSAIVKVCANNGDDSIESCSSVNIVKAIPTGYIAGYLGEYDGTTTTYGVNSTNLSLKLYADSSWTDLPSFIETSCNVTTESRFTPPKPNSPIYSPKPIGLSYACTITYNSDAYVGGDIPENELTSRKFFLGPASTTGYDNKLYCVNPTPQVGNTYAFSNCDICLNQHGCTSTEAMSCKDIEPPLIPPHGKLTPTPILEWTSAGNCRANNFTGVLNFKNQNNLDTVRYKNIVFKINKYNTFFKQQNTAFQSHAAIENHIPASIKPFSDTASEDNGDTFMIIGEADDAASTVQQQYEHLSGTGLILSDLENGSASVSKLGWINKSYLPVTHINANDYYDYTKARKKYAVITNITTDDIPHRGCYIHNGAFDYTGQTVAPYPIVFISNGTVTIKSNLAPTSSIIFIAPKIVFNNEVTNAKGVFIGNEIKVVSDTNNIDPTDPDYLTTIINKPLLITGNLVALNVPIKNWQRKLTDNRQPALFVKFDVKQYTDGMPCLGVSKYKWNQLQ